MGQRMMMLCVVVAMLMAGWSIKGTNSKSIIREMLQERMQFLPDGRAANRPGRQFEDMPIERCRVTQNKELTTKLNRLCDECFQIYRVPNFYMKCRANCFDNEIFRDCGKALYRQELTKEFNKFIETEVKLNGVTLPPTVTAATEKSTLAEVQEALLQLAQTQAAA